MAEAHWDRLCRFGFERIGLVCCSHGCNLMVMNWENLSQKQKVVKGLQAIKRLTLPVTARIV